jgi:hypothetical protein
MFCVFTTDSRNVQPRALVRPGGGGGEYFAGFLGSRIEGAIK